MWRVAMLEAEGFEAEGADIVLEAMRNELEHIEDLMQTMLLQAIAARWNIKPSGY
jgi:hypothetical protein